MGVIITSRSNLKPYPSRLNFWAKFIRFQNGVLFLLDVNRRSLSAVYKKDYMKWIRSEEHNLRSSIGSSRAIAHSIHVGLLPGLLVMQGEDGSPAVIYKGESQCLDGE